MAPEGGGRVVLAAGGVGQEEGAEGLEAEEVVGLAVQVEVDLGWAEAGLGEMEKEAQDAVGLDWEGLDAEVPVVSAAD